MARTLPSRWTAFGDCFDSSCCGTVTSTTSPCVVNGVGYEEFDDIAEMLASAPKTTGWRTCRVENWLPLDGNVSYWWRLDSLTETPNGSNVLQCDDGAIVERTYIKEGLV